MPTFTNSIAGIPSAGLRGATNQPATQAACCCPACAGLECLDRTRFFAGQLLSEADLNNEQSYWLAKNRLHNRMLHGWGIVCGLQVLCAECPGWVTVQSGYAIDGCGNDIIVCKDTPFNVIKAIQACCAPTKPANANCSPLRYTPSLECKDAIQTWCITIQYQEQPSRMIAPLTTGAAQCHCGCSCGRGNGNGNGSNGKGNGSGCSSTAKQTTTTPATCEPTRIVEGFTLGVVPVSEVDAAFQEPAPGSLIYQLEQCGVGLVALLQAPNLTDNPQNDYQLTCNYVLAVKQYFSKNPDITHCKILDDLALIQVPPPGPQTTEGTYQGIIAQVHLLLVFALLDCLCYSLLRPCPPAPCDNRLVLACVTVQDDKIIDICHFRGRKPLVTLGTLRYWFGPILDPLLLGRLDKLLANFCCADEEQFFGIGGFNNNRFYDQENITSAGLTNPAMMNRIAAHYVSQTLGASVMNAILPGAGAQDLRPLVGQNAEFVMGYLGNNNFSNVTVTSVDDDPSWTANAVAAGQQYAPAAVSSGQPLTVYTKGKVAVGIEVVDPITARLNALEQQMGDLHNRFNADNNPTP